MTLQQFRRCMGLLGFNSISILADRIFQCMDKENKNRVSLQEFLEYMDIIVHGSKEEKCYQSFKLIAQHQEFIAYQEFSSWLRSVRKMFNQLTESDSQ